MAAEVDLERELDRLYGDPPDGFVAERNDLAKRLKAGDRSDDAAAVKKLKKPTRPAALVNWLSREREKQVRALAKVAERMRDPKLSDGKKLRAAVADERKAIEDLLAAAAEELGERGGPAATLDRVAETLRAMASDPDVERLVLERRLEREQEASTIGFAPEGGVSSPPAKPSRATREKAVAEKQAKPKGPDLKKLRRDRQDAEKAARAAEGAIADGEARAEAAEAELKAARAAVREAKAEAKRARTEARKLERRLQAAEREG